MQRSHHVEVYHMAVDGVATAVSVVSIIRGPVLRGSSTCIILGSRGNQRSRAAVERQRALAAITRRRGRASAR
ncbi:hypothetical protein EVAR_87282_1 [Eumeta japonica]|uniref:Uncharacterized protein n=1 Tax=Eumeta variegata TaxID=151549 RepID=A0A4C1VVX8_EUMVA|nr:hypothetical protein EVAR_87282_1 [Eumeta japonica]